MLSAFLWMIIALIVWLVAEFVHAAARHFLTLGLDFIAGAWFLWRLFWFLCASYHWVFEHL